MALIAELVEEIKNDKIKNEDLIICLETENLRVVAMAMFKIIERNYCDKRIVNRLTQSLLKWRCHWEFTSLNTARGHLQITL